MNKFVAFVLILCLLGFVWVVGCGEPAKPNTGTSTTTTKAVPPPGGAPTATPGAGATTPGKDTTPDKGTTTDKGAAGSDTTPPPSPEPGKTDKGGGK